MADTGNYGIISSNLDHNSILKFYEVAQRREFARKFQFKIKTLGPLNEDDLIYFTTANVPARSISNHTVPFIGLQYNIPGAAQYDGSDSWQVTFRCDEAANIRAKLLAWQDEIFNIQQTGGKYGVPNEQAKVIQLGKDISTPVRTFSLVGIYPKTIGELSYDITDSGDIQTFNATFAYQFWYES